MCTLAGLAMQASSTSFSLLLKRSVGAGSQHHQMSLEIKRCTLYGCYACQLTFDRKSFT